MQGRQFQRILNFMSPPTASSPREAAKATPGFVATVTRLWPYLWPHGRPDLQRRVFLAFALLLVAKGATMVTPFAFKWATDALVAASGNGSQTTEAAATAGSWLWRAPLLLTVIYGITRIGMAGFTPARAPAAAGDLGNHAHRRGGAPPGAGRFFRQGRHARRAQARPAALRAHAPPLPEVSSGA